MNETPKPAQGAILPQWAVVALTILVSLAGVVLAVSQTVALPPWVPAVAVAVTAIGAGFGIMSPGIRRSPVADGEVTKSVTTLDQAAETLRKGPQP